MGFLQFAPKIGEGDMARLERDEFFPFCVKQASGIFDGETFFQEIFPSGSSEQYIPVVGPGSLHPFGMTLAEVMKLTQRLAVFRLESQIDVRVFELVEEEATYPIRTASFNNVAYEASLSLDPVKRQVALSQYKSEESLSCENNFDVTFDALTGDFDADFYEIEIQWLLQIIITDDEESIPVARIYEYEGLFYPQFRARINVFDEDFGSAYFADTVGSEGFPGVPFPVTFCTDFSTSLLVDSAFVSDGPEVEGVTDLFLTISPLKWLPYKDAAGTPLYDEDTGDRI
jgi:hypothetical protein